MEVFGARPEEPSRACFAEIDDCHLFVGIYAHRYGFVPNDSHVSITEAEFHHAKTSNKPVFCFVVNEDHPWPPEMIEDEPGKSKLLCFKTKIRSGLVLETFTSAEDLAFKIAAALGRYMATIRNPGTPTFLASPTALFDKILSELTTLRHELHTHKELLQRVQHISDLLQAPEETVEACAAMNNALPLYMEGSWFESVTRSTLYARFVDGELLVPYRLGERSNVTGVFFDCRKRAENIFFARYKWINSPVQGFAYIEFSGPSRSTGGWWYSEDVPKEALKSMGRFYHNLPRMNELALSKRLEPKSFPKWAEDILSMPKTQLLKLLTADV